MSPRTDRYWAQFLDALPHDTERPRQYYEAFYFGTTKESARLLTPLVLNGVKTATGSLQWVYEAEGRLPPQVGDHSIVMNGDDEPVCIIRDTEIRIIAFNEVDEAFAWDGGEDDRTLESWRWIYRDYIRLECARIGREPTPQTPLACERFQIVHKEPLKLQ